MIWSSSPNSIGLRLVRIEDDAVVGARVIGQPELSVAQGDLAAPPRGLDDRVEVDRAVHVDVVGRRLQVDLGALDIEEVVEHRLQAAGFRPAG